MKKNIWLTIISILLIFSLAGCATDQQLTKTQGTGIGAIVGGLIGGTAGVVLAVATGNSDIIVPMVAIGAGVGTAVGAIAGYNWGENVVHKKEEFTKTEAYLDASIVAARATTEAAASENKTLQDDIAEHDEDTKELIDQYHQGKADRQALIDKAAEIDGQRAEVQQKIEHTTQQIAIAGQQLAEAGSGPTSAEETQKLAELNGQIQALSAQKAELERHNLELAQVSNRIGV